MKFTSPFLLLLFMAVTVFAQKAKPPINWHLRNIDDTIAAGINVDKAYAELLKGKTPKKKIIVAVIDGGTESTHEDLKSVIWVNPEEIAGNGKDDDNNGYIDDINGWNFIGGKNGEVQFDHYEFARIYKTYKAEFESNALLEKSSDKKVTRKVFEKARKDFEIELSDANAAVKNVQEKLEKIAQLKKMASKDSLTLKDLEMINTEDQGLLAIIADVKKSLSAGNQSSKAYEERLNELLKNNKKDIDYRLNLEFDPRAVVGDNYTNTSERNYGNNRVIGPDSKHGTAVAGCIAAIRNNNLGMQGVTNEVEIVIVRAIPDGDERDKDVANSIRYAVNMGASVINMSFGKAYATDQKEVQEALKYAASKDVLVVHAAGNDGKNTDINSNFPNNLNAKGKVMKNVLTVGASTATKTAARFSNYGKKSVDVFAPGQAIYTCFPGSTYGYINGTSFSCPITAGVAALIRTYYPDLSAEDVKKILIKSAYKIKGKVTTPGTADQTIEFKDLCKSGGIVDAYKALQLAESWK